MKNLMAFILCLFLTSPAWADTKLSALATNSSPAASDVAYEEAGGTSYGVTLSTLKTFFTTANVGINSASPGQQLDVQGTVRAVLFSGPLTGNVTGNVTGSSGSTTGNAATATALAANGTNCSAGSFPLGVDASGNSESCTVAGTSSAVGANPTATVGTAAVNGASANFMRADGAPAIDLTMIPTWTGTHTFNNTTYGFVTGTGNVGIGSATPGQKMDVQGTVRIITGTLQMTGTTKDSYFNSTGGNVGIGSVTPGTKLDVQGTIRSLGFINTGLTASTPRITDANKLEASGSYKGNTTVFQMNNGTLTSGNLVKSDANQNIVDAGVSFGTLTDTKTCTYTAGSTSISCTSSGGGAASAAGGTNAVQYNSGSSTFAGNEAIFSMNGTNVGIGTTNGIMLLDVRGNAYHSGNIGIGTTLLTTSALTVMSGNVGIGTWVPAQALDIKGNLRMPASTATTGIIYSGANSFINNYGTENFFGGAQAGNFTLTGADNAVIGFQAFAGATINRQSVAVGAYALNAAINSYNTAVGYNTLGVNTNGAYNTAIGYSALSSNISSFDNTAVGESALAVSTGKNNTGMGSIALFGNTTGSNNTAVGFQAGIPLGVNGTVAGTNNTWIGVNSGPVGTTDVSNSVGIGSYALAGANNVMVLGGTGVNALNVGIGTDMSSASGRLIVSGGNVGIGSLTPGQLLDVKGTVRLLGSGHLISLGTAPTVANNDCGSTAQGTVTAGSTDMKGSFTVGTLTVTSCAVTFAGTFVAAPVCITQDDTNVLGTKTATTTTKMTTTSTTSMSGDVVYYHCIE